MLQRIQTQIENNSQIDDIPEEMQIKKDYKTFVFIQKSFSNTVFKIEQTKIYESIRKQSDRKYIVYKFPYNENQLIEPLQLNIPHLIQKLNQSCLVNLIHPENIYDEQNYIFLTQQQDINNFQLSNCKHRFNKQMQLLLVTQLCITLQELERRKFPSYILNPNNIYIIEGVLHISLIHFNFEEFRENNFESFKQFVAQYFQTQEYCQDNFEKTTDNLLSKLQYNNYEEGCRYLSFIKKIFQINDLIQFSTGSNSFTYSSSRPKLFSIFPEIKNTIFIKVPKILDDNDQEVTKYRLLQTQRELMFNEQLIEKKKFATFFAYLQIQKISFFFYFQYPLTLDQLFEKLSKITDNNPLQSLQYKFAMQLAISLNELHKMQILHRDIKPQNVFLTSIDENQANLKIADFDRSRKINEKNEHDSIGDYTIFSSTYDFNPPEAFGTNYDFSSDVWQFGLTLFQMANNGNYPPVKSALIFSEEDYQKINLDFIKQVLQDKQNINQEYIRLISKCLEFKLEDRITLKQFIEALRVIRIDMNDQDDVLENDNDYCADMSTSNFDNTIYWQKNFTQGQNKTPFWNQDELPQSLGDTSIYDL